MVFEGIKYTRKVKGTIKIKADFVYPSEVYEKHFSVFKEILHKNNMKFYCGENRLRYMGDSLCCCGIDGLGWQENKYNLNHFLYDKDGYIPTDNMKMEGTSYCFQSLKQESKTREVLKRLSFASCMDLFTKDIDFLCGLSNDEKGKLIREIFKKKKSY